MDIKSVLGAIAPTLATMLAGPEAGLAVSALEKATGLTSGSGLGAVSAAVTTSLTGDQIVAIKKADLEHQDRLTQIASDNLKTQVVSETSQVVEVNKTMQTEDVSGKTSGWRELCGYSLAITSFVTAMGVLFLAYLAISGKDPSALTAIPTIVSSIAMVLAIPGAAVGINAYHSGLADRGK